MKTACRSALTAQAATLCLVMGGCVSPWSRARVVELPSTRTTPTHLQRPAVPPVAGQAIGPDEDSVTGAAAGHAMPGRSTAEQGQASAAEEVEVVVEEEEVVVRGQNAWPAAGPQGMTPGSDDHYRRAMPVSGLAGNAAMQPSAPPQVQPVQYLGPSSGYSGGGVSPRGAESLPNPGIAPPSGPGYLSGNPGYAPDASITPYPGAGPVPYAPGNTLGVQPLPDDTADLVVNLRETQTGRFMFGVGVNSDLGLTAQVIIDERNFDWRRLPRSVDDIINGTAFRGGGQALRIEAIPGTEVQRYLVNFTEPYLLDTAISLNVSGFLYDRRFFDWDEERLGGRVGLGYRITPDLSLSAAMRLESVDITNPRVLGVPELDRSLGQSELYSGRVTLTHDTRDIPFAPTEGHYLELGYEQAFGSFDYPRGTVDYRRYFLLRERADGSGRHTLGTSIQAGFTGSQTPIYENFFAGGYSTMRGFRFRHASPKDSGVIVGGEFSLLGSVEYLFPITADDMLKGIFFCDYGSVEEEIELHRENFRVAPGFGLRVSIPAMGPAPIAVDFAVPIARAETDQVQNLSFFLGFGR